MRFYGFGNYYLSSLQQGLQAAHVVGDLSVNSISNGSVNQKGKLYFDWAANHKTMVLLNGGNSETLLSIFNKFKDFESKGMHLPFAAFHEDTQSLGGALTYVGIILEEKYYTASSQLRSENDVLGFVMEKLYSEKWKYWELELIKELNNYSLAH